jgi:hypothetical protein
MKRFTSLLCMALLCASSVPAFAMDTAERLNVLERALKEQARIIEEQQRTIESMKEEINRGKTEASAPAVEPVEAAEDSSLASKVSGFFGGSVLTNPNISLVVDTFGYTSNLKKEELEEREIEQRKGFNLRAAELYLFAPVDAYFNLYAAIPITEEEVELEEAYAVTTFLPFGLQVKGGKFKSNFSRLDAQHPHAWDFADIALPYKAFLGEEALGGEKGVQLTWLPPLSFYTLLGGEVLQGENDHLFGADARSGPHAYTLFAKTSFDTGDNSSLLFGPYVLFGKAYQPSDEGLDFRGNSNLWGVEAVWKWKQGVQGVTLQGEYLYLAQNGREVTDPETGDTVSRRLHRDGAYVQALYRYERWRVGARYDTLDLFSDDLKRGGVEEELGRRPWRTTAALEFNPSEFSRIRLQYTHDESTRDGVQNDEWWLQFIFGIGAHGAHEF